MINTSLLGKEKNDKHERTKLFIKKLMTSGKLKNRKKNMNTVYEFYLVHRYYFKISISL